MEAAVILERFLNSITILHQGNIGKSIETVEPSMSYAGINYKSYMESVREQHCFLIGLKLALAAAQSYLTGKAVKIS